MFAHITWHTWNRVECVDQRAAAEVRVAVLSAGKRTGVQLIKGEVLTNHVHLLVSFRPDTRLSDFIRLAKAVSATATVTEAIDRHMVSLVGLDRRYQERQVRRSKTGKYGGQELGSTEW